MDPHSLARANDGLSLRGGARQRGEEAPQVGSHPALEVLEVPYRGI